ncbi:hypothetical protein, partial [Novipirellula maiorica]|uniref:hypothetical protein n=1 Tax=Novipirellula maiorica TaxID=1265734 RepID=UPI00059433C2
MQSKTALLLLFTSVIALTAIQSTSGQDPSPRFDGDQSGRQEVSDANENATQGMAELRQAITRLEAKVDQLLAQPSDSPRSKCRSSTSRG